MVWVGDIALTQAEADKLLKMMKKSLEGIVDFPRKNTKTEFEVMGDTERDIFTICIYRGKINPKKYDYGARIKKNGILLLELHIGPSNVHINPNGEKLRGDHWHIYTEEYGRRVAFPAEGIESEKFIENTLFFFKTFNIIKPPQVYYQMEWENQ